jgi:hypothetical protein
MLGHPTPAPGEEISGDRAPGADRDSPEDEAIRKRYQAPSTLTLFPVLLGLVSVRRGGRDGWPGSSRAPSCTQLMHSLHKRPILIAPLASPGAVCFPNPVWGADRSPACSAFFSDRSCSVPPEVAHHHFLYDSLLSAI